MHVGDAYPPRIRPAAPKVQKTLPYLTPAQIDPSHLLEPPAKDGSQVQQREMAAVKRLIKARTAERFAQAKWDAEHEDVTPFAATIGPDIRSARSYPLRTNCLKASSTIRLSQPALPKITSTASFR